MSEETDSLKSNFTDTFGPGGHLRIVRAPGRVNLIGEHTDYNDGFVFPMAIEQHVTIVSRARDDGIVRLASTAFPKQISEFSLEKSITRGEPTWANYSKGVAAGLKAAGIPLKGVDALIDNTLPVGGGLSSSAAIEVGTARTLLTHAGAEMDAQKIALLAQEAEHKYALVPCGIMDQTIVAAGKAAHAMLLDCRDLSKKFIPIDPAKLRVVIVNSMVKHELTGGEYAERRKQCETAVAFFKKFMPKVKALRDVTIEQLQAEKEILPDVIFRRARHVIGENVRTLEAAEKLTAGEYKTVGQLMVQSHNSLRDDYEVSVPQLDYLVEESMKIDGVYGARMTGGGFGGCIVALVDPPAVEKLSTHLRRSYPARFNKHPGVFITSATAGASVLE